MCTPGSTTGTTAVYAYAAGPLSVVRLLPPPVITAARPNGSIFAGQGAVSVPSGASQTPLQAGCGIPRAAVIVDGVTTGISALQVYNVMGTIHQRLLHAGRLHPHGYVHMPTVASRQAVLLVVNRGAVRPNTITPNTGYEVRYVVVDGVSKGAITSFHLYKRDCEPHDHSAVHFHHVPDNSERWPQWKHNSQRLRGICSSKAFTITPAAGYHIADVLVDGASVGAVTSYTFTM